MLKELTTEDLNEEIKEGLVLVDFFATWCGPCKMMHPVLEELVANNKTLKVIKIDTDKHDELARTYGVMSIPTIILFKDSEIVEKNIGYTPLETLQQWIDKQN